MVAVGILIATMAAVIISAVYYGAMPADPDQEPAPPHRPTVAVLTVEVLRSLTIAALVAGLLAASDRGGLGTGALLGIALWTIPVALLAGSVFHEGVPTRRAALHAVDWLIKLTATGAIIGALT